MTSGSCTERELTIQLIICPDIRCLCKRLNTREPKSVRQPHISAGHTQSDDAGRDKHRDIKGKLSTTGQCTCQEQLVIPSMDNIFSMFGIPRVIKTDNGPPFNGSQFSQFARYMGFHHRKITPLWPQANATAERFMRTIGKIVRIAPMQGMPWKQQLNIFLREYRSTPHSTGKSPAELVFQIHMNTKIPSACPITIHTDSEVHKKDTKAKAKMKARSDDRRHATPFKSSQVTLLCRQLKQNKLLTAENHSKSRVKGSMVTAGRNGYAITRDSSFFKRIHLEAQLDPLPHLDPDLDPDPDDSEDAEQAPPPPRHPVR